MSIVPPAEPEATPPADERGSELRWLADFIESHARTSFDHRLAAMLHATDAMHADWAENCAAAHQYTEIPCDDYLNGLSLGIAWLKGQIEDRT